MFPLEPFSLINNITELYNCLRRFYDISNSNTIIFKQYEKENPEKNEKNFQQTCFYKKIKKLRFILEIFKSSKSWDTALKLTNFYLFSLICFNANQERFFYN